MNENQMIKLLRNTEQSNNQNIQTALTNLPTTAGALFLHIRSLCSNRQQSYSVRVKVATLADFVGKNENQIVSMLELLVSKKLIKLYGASYDTVDIKLNPKCLDYSAVQASDFNNDVERVSRMLKGDK